MNILLALCMTFAATPQESVHLDISSLSGNWDNPLYRRLSLRLGLAAQSREPSQTGSLVHVRSEFKSYPACEFKKICSRTGKNSMVMSGQIQACARGNAMRKACSNANSYLFTAVIEDIVTRASLYEQSHGG